MEDSISGLKSKESGSAPRVFLLDPDPPTLPPDARARPAPRRLRDEDDTDLPPLPLSVLAAPALLNGCLEVDDADLKQWELLLFGKCATHVSEITLRFGRQTGREGGGSGKGEGREGGGCSVLLYRCYSFPFFSLSLLSSPLSYPTTSLFNCIRTEQDQLALGFPCSATTPLT